DSTWNDGGATSTAWTAVGVVLDHGYDSRAFVEQMREMKVTPHVAQNTANGRSAIDRRTTRPGGYQVSSASASGWRKSSAGSKRWHCSAERVSAAWSEPAGCSASRRQLITWSDADHSTRDHTTTASRLCRLC